MFIGGELRLRVKRATEKERAQGLARLKVTARSCRHPPRRARIPPVVSRRQLRRGLNFRANNSKSKHVTNSDSTLAIFRMSRLAESPSSAPTTARRLNATVPTRAFLTSHYYCNITPSLDRVALRTRNERAEDAHSVMSLQRTARRLVKVAESRDGTERKKKPRRHDDHDPDECEAHDNAAERRAISLDTDCVPRV